ncbi:MAG: hypothetical protein A2365_01885 [Candidatus Nealsonbacteria bacterium RIFOXYB1_FULL_40_15]|uniref:Pseudouridine synthase RsuA/RluA-like domain-containing protein n=2 Tax=Candidatus Nealsoniibacteriota TaxID=1817911 RepID=A0A1G2ESR4_9BACT|nr:MAG: hypothetical protein A2365_01885 [Candidatus Nealsonbacteria bacterium RIFOXYB1_FULL_40_15]OGZ28865.1 MAG: hypothetical protein A2427_03790 [Candidatus Nealsonbacteria bacterium RIFOXYC1_FULL_40_7]OGZ29258.1 MAG: hypothetical protein A2562_00300 [Candidatus Nealsonbacteria bacterium RIFOXYD1_FULL_39_11]
MDALYEDNHIIAVFKPAGVLVQEDSSGDESLQKQVKGFLKQKYGKKGNVFLGVLHRIDRPVSGIVLFAKTTKGASRISAQFRAGEIQKTYLVLVSGLPKDSEGCLKNLLEKRGGKAIISVKGKESILCYKVLKSNGEYSLLELTPKTGRFHQIRAQLSNMGNPILDDLKYGGKLFFKNRSIALVASGISFKKAVGGEKVELSINMPSEWERVFKNNVQKR